MSFLDNVAQYVGTEWAQLYQPVFNNLGRQIGYYTDDKTLASGHIMLFQGETLPSPDQWFVNKAGIIGMDVTPAAQHLVDVGLQPSWLTGQAAQAVKDAGTSLATTLGLKSPFDWTLPPSAGDTSTSGGGGFQFPAISWPTLPSLALPQLPTAAPSWLLIGGLGILTTVVLMRPTRRRRRR